MATIRNLIIRIGVHDAEVRAGVERVKKEIGDLEKHAEALQNLSRSAGLAVLAGSAVQLVTALAPAVGVLGAVPSAAAGAAAALLPLKLGLSGVGEVLGSAITGDAKKFNEQLKALPPAARSVVGELGKTFGGLQAIAQQALFEPMKGAAKGLAQDLRGPLTTGVAQVAAAWGRLGARVLGVLRESATISFLQRLFANVARAIDGVGRGVPVLLRGFRDLANVFLGSFGRIGNALGEAMTKAGLWLSRIAVGGQATRWMSAAVVVLGQLWRIVVNLGSALLGIFGAASSGAGTLLNSIVQLTAKFAAWTHSAEGKEKLGDTFRLLGQTLQNLMQILPSVLPVIVQLATAFSKLPQPVQGVLSKFLAWTILAGLVGTKVAPLVSGLGLVGKAFFKGGDAAGGMAAKVGKAAGSFAVSAGKMAASAAASTGRIIASWAVVGAHAVAESAKAVAAFARASAAAVAEGAKAAATFAIVAARVVGGWILMGVQAMANAVRMAAAWLIAMGPIALVIAAVVAIVVLIVMNWNKIKSWTVQAWQFVWDWIKKIAGFIWQLFLNWTIYGQVIKHWTQIRDTTVAVWNAIVNWIKGIPGRFMANLSALGNLASKVGGWFAGMAKAAVNQVNWLLGQVARVPGLILRSLGDLGKLLYNSGRNVMIGLWNGLASMAQWIYNAVMRLVHDIIPGPVRSVLGIASPSTLFHGFGVNLGQGLALGMNSSRELVSRAARGLAEAAAVAPGTPGYGWSTPTPPGTARAAARRQPGTDYARMAAALTEAMRRQGVGAAYLDGRLVSDTVSRYTGRATEQRRRTG